MLVRLAFAFALAAGAASAETANYYPETGYFDPVEAVVPLHEDGGDPAHAMRCTYYADMILRQTQTDSPGFGPVFVMARPPGTARPACSGKMGLHESRIDVSGEGTIGKRGGFLFFSPTDGDGGAEPFEVYRIRDGRKLYSDTRLPDRMNAVTADGDTLRLNYPRAVNAPCSILQQGPVCWARTVKAARLVGAVAAQPAPVAACVEAYRRAKAEPSDASMATYDVDLRIGADGKAVVLSRGKVGCAPMS